VCACRLTKLDKLSHLIINTMDCYLFDRSVISIQGVISKGLVDAPDSLLRMLKLDFVHAGEID
jgi:hypothetical protein